jgi:hypothetical protein
VLYFIIADRILFIMERKIILGWENAKGIYQQMKSRMKKQSRNIIWLD